MRIKSPFLRSLVFFVTASLLVVLSACTTNDATKQLDTSNDSADKDRTPDVVAELNPDQKQQGEVIDPADDPNLPKVEMDAAMLEQLLALNFASYAGDWPRASANAIEAARSSQDYRVARLATMLALRNNDYQLAAEGAELWSSLVADDIDAINMRILSLVGSGQTEEAIIAIDKSQADLTIDDHIKQIATLLVRQRNAETGFDVANHLVESNPDSAQVMLSAAYVAESFERYEAAEVWVANALQLRPKWDLAAQMQSNLYGTQGKTQERADFIAQFVEENPNSVAMRISHATELAREKKYQAAFELMQAVLKDAPENVSGLQYAGALAEQLEQPKQAVKLYQRGLRLAPNNDDLRWSLARIAVSDKNYVKAEQLFGEIQNQDLAFRAQLQVANMRYETQGVDVAVNTLWTLEPQTNEEWLEVVQTRHYMLMRAHQYEEALGYINEAIVYVPDNADLLYSRALVAAELKDVEIAEQDLRAIIKQNPQHANALNALGYTLADQTDRLQEARDLIEKALELRPKDAHILDSMGWVLYRLKELDSAIEYLRKAYDASPEIEIAAHLGEVLWESGDTIAANEVWQKSFDEDSANPVLLETLKRYGVELSSSTVQSSS